MAFLELSGITKSYGSVNVLKDVTLLFNLNEFVAILGPSGCGKTTLLEIIGLQEKCDKGHLLINDKKIKKRQRRIYLANLFGFIYQHFHLIPYFTVQQNLDLALLKHKTKKEFSCALLEKLGIADKINAYPDELSGGEQQRVAIARTLLRENKVLLADEPTGHLDSGNAEMIMDLLKNNSEGRLIIFATHDEKLARKYATRIIYLEQSGVCKEEFLEEPLGLEQAPINHYLKPLGFLTLFKQTLISYKKRKKGIISVFLLFAICLLGIMFTFGLSEGANTYLACLKNNKLDAKYVSFSYYENNKEKTVPLELETYLKSNNVHYYQYYNLNFLINNFMLEAFFVDETKINFNYSVSFIDYTLLNKYQLGLLGLSSTPKKETALINSCFAKKCAEAETIHIRYDSFILASTLNLDKSFTIAATIDEGSSYNQAKIYLDNSYFISILPTDFKNYFFKEQEIVPLPLLVKITSDFESAYKLIENYPNMHNLYEAYEFKEDQYFIFDNSTVILRSAFSSLLDSFTKILIFCLIMIFLCTLSLLSLVLTYILKERSQEIALLKTFGLSNEEIFLLGLSEASLLTGAALFFSLLATFFASRLLFSLTPSLFDQTWAFNLLPFSSRGLVTCLFVSLMAAILAITPAIRRCQKKALGEVLKDE
ncbi:MAG: ATP-binding cassette domain-containing protein [Bacilli bacterium]|jgi:ABC-type lipoprotein export system ATPase subunit/ABC-type antimicrobial peptide transport system permease subunit